MPSVSDIIQIAKVSQYLAIRAIALGGHTDKLLPRKLYCVRKNVEWLHTINSGDSSLTKTANYLYALCPEFNLAAQAIINAGNGGSVAPVTGGSAGINWIRILSGDFANATDFILPSLKGKTFRLQANWLGSRYLEPETEWEYLPEGGFRILLDGFDSSLYEYEIYLDIQGQTTALSGTVSWENITGKPDTLVEYNLTETTEINYNGNVTTVLTVAIYPNGNDYTWGSMFVFTDSWPTQPAATGVGTTQLYIFQYVSGRYICIGQSITI
jgi:hypothetical protein